MLEHLQPGFVTPRILYNGLRQRVHPEIWATDQDVPNENDPNPSQSNIHVPESLPWRERVRPQAWKRADDEQPQGSRCHYTVSFLYSSDTNDGQSIYVQQDALAVCYYNNTPVGSLSYAGPTPPGCAPPILNAAISGFFINFTAPINFRCWWNLFSVCGPAPADTSVIRIENIGDCPVIINGIHYNPGDVFIQNGSDLDPANGDESGYLGGSSVSVTPA